MTNNTTNTNNISAAKKTANTPFAIIINEILILCNIKMLLIPSSYTAITLSLIINRIIIALLLPLLINITTNNDQYFH